MTNSGDADVATRDDAKMAMNGDADVAMNGEKNMAINGDMKMAMNGDTDIESSGDTDMATSDDAKMATSFEFLSLPLELRHLVYAFYLTDTTIAYTQEAFTLPTEGYTIHTTKHLDCLPVTCKTIHAEFEEEALRLSNTIDGPLLSIRLRSPSLVHWPTAACIAPARTYRLTLDLDPDYPIDMDLDGLWDLLTKIAHLHVVRIELKLTPGRVLSSREPCVACLVEGLVDELDPLDAHELAWLGVRCAEWSWRIVRDVVDRRVWREVWDEPGEETLRKYW